MSDPGTIAPGWSEYKLLVLDKLEMVCAQIKELEHKVDSFRSDDIAGVKVDIALLKQKAGMWGAIAGLVPSLIAAVVWWLTHGK